MLKMLLHVERGELEQATLLDVAILGYLKETDRDSVENRALMIDLLAAYKSLKGKLSDEALATRDEISKISTSKEGLSAYNRVRQY